MSLVGPRPQVKADADLYTYEERRLLTVRPGVTDLASIVFADEGRILGNSANPRPALQSDHSPLEKPPGAAVH